MVQWPGLTKRLHRQVLNISILTATQDSSTAALTLTDGFLTAPVDCDIVRVDSYCHADPTAADLTVSVYNGATTGTDQVCSFTHGASLTVPDKQTKQGSDLSSVSLEEGDTIGIFTGSTLASTGPSAQISVTVTIERHE